MLLIGPVAECMTGDMRAEAQNPSAGVWNPSRNAVAAALRGGIAYNQSAMKRPGRRRFLTTALGGAAVSATFCSKPSSGQRPPNVLLLVADGLGPGNQSSYGEQQVRTPRLDELASQGMRFTQAYSGCCLPVPSRCVLLTGLNMGHASIRSNAGGVPLLLEDITLAEMLMPRGYVSGCFGKWGLGEAGTEGVPWEQGFEEFFGYLNEADASSLYPPQLYDNGEEWPVPGNESGGRAGFAPDLIAGRALDFLRRHEGGPFFCYVSFPLPQADLPTPEAAILRLDQDVGLLLDLLGELDIESETLVIFTAARGAGGFPGYPGGLYEAGIRVPLIARWPGRIESASQSGFPVVSYDFLPTLAELAELDRPAYADGVSLVPTLTGRGRQEQHPFLYWEVPAQDAETGEFIGVTPMQAVLVGDWKAVRPAAGAELELYNLASDPTESTNVIGQHPEVAAEMVDLLKRTRYDPRPNTQTSSAG